MALKTSVIETKNKILVKKCGKNLYQMQEVKYESAKNVLNRNYEMD